MHLLAVLAFYCCVKESVQMLVLREKLSIKMVTMLLLAIIVSSCASYKPLNPAFHKALSQPYTLDSGDVLRVTVFDQEELTNTYSVDKGGYISFPLVGAVAARGKTTNHLEGHLATKLRQGFLRNPDVTGLTLCH